MGYSLGASAVSIAPPPPPTTIVKYEPSRNRRVLIHRDFEDWFSNPATDQQFVRKARFQIKNLLARGYCPNAKSVVGEGKGWLRAALGGSGGFQYYLWHCGHASEIGKSLGLGPGQFAVRIVRHHDETGSSLDPGSLASDYGELTPSDVEGVGGDQYYTKTQREVALEGRATVQTLRGYPGSGKTTCLWLTANHSSSRQILYITYSKRLAREAVEFFDAFSPEGVSVDVVTFEELLNHLADERDDVPSALSVEEAVGRMVSILPPRKDFVGGWDGHFHELYAELHAYGVGRALPVEFLGVPGTDDRCLDGATFRNLRGEALGEKMADSAADVLEQLRSKDLIEELFPGPTKAKTLLADVSEPPTERLANVGMVLVDEVQDLTLSESFLILNVAARIGVASGTMPRMVFAGDESQTVRPTSFRWADLKNLVTSVLGELAVMEDRALEQNLRSPAQIARFVEATRSQYAMFDKEDRPAGITYTEVNESLNGRLVYCSLRDEREWMEVVRLFSQLSRARLVYPGFEVPDELMEGLTDTLNMVTSSDVKGLDFDAVALIDAGSTQHRLRRLLDSRDDEPHLEVFGRTLADQYRVAASRASETLVLLDRDGIDNHEAIVRLCEDRKGLSLELERVDVEGLRHVLEEDLDHESLIRALIDDVKRIIDDRPEQAILRVRSIHKQFETFQRLGPVPSDLRFEVLRLRGVSALVAVLRGVEVPSVPRELLLAEARSALNQIDLGGAYEAVHELAVSTESWSSSTHLERLVAGVEKLEQVERELPEVRRSHTEKLVTWLDQLSKRDCPADESRVKNVLDTASAMIKKLVKEYPHVDKLDQTVARKWIESLVGLRKWTFALGILERLEVRDHRAEGDCHFELSNFAKAVVSYELAGEPSRALNSARSIPDLELSIRIATEYTLPDLATLNWLKALDTTLSERTSAVVGDLTKAERDRLAVAMKGFLK